MMTAPKITFIGAGSTIFVKNILGDVFHREALKTAHIALMDIDPTRLEESHIVVRKLMDSAGASGKITCHTQQKEALEDADFVVVAFQIGGYEPCTVTDFEVCKRHGLEQTIADTLGPGGIMRALRTIPHLWQICEDMTEVCPDATMLNYVNPMAMNTWAMYARYPHIKQVGLCHSVQGTAEELAFRVNSGSSGWPEDLSAVCGRVADLFRRLPEMADPRVLWDEDGTPEDVFPFPYLSRDTSRQKPCRTLSEALEIYYGERDAKDRLNQKSAGMTRTLRSQIERCEKKLAIQEEALTGAERMDEYRMMGEAINANLFQLKKGMTEAVLPDWYHPEGGEITVPLDSRLTPSQNAQRYFKKYQKARSARETAALQKQKTLEELDFLEGMLLDVDKCVGESELEEIRQELVRAGYMKKNTNRRQQRQLPQSKPYRYLRADGIEIRVGKNAAQNDRLTQSARPEEMWLHAKDMPGSHVIIQCEGEIPQETLKQAALLAAWYSKGKGVSVPVDYTLRKFVKKPATRAGLWSICDFKLSGLRRGCGGRTCQRSETSSS